MVCLKVGHDGPGPGGVSDELGLWYGGGFWWYHDLHPSGIGRVVRHGVFGKFGVDFCTAF